MELKDLKLFNELATELDIEGCKIDYNLKYILLLRIVDLLDFDEQRTPL